MNNTYGCVVCRNQILSAATHYVTEYGQVLCVECAENPASHAVVHPACPVTAHTVGDHPVIVGTRLGAHRALMRMAAQGVATG
jgi:hypothetical protein